jgi:hypothetical protein|tara:strand:+ start:309 stop:713 length:405 start_codon:yes stop_codon:yes gene_type:complete
MLDVGSVVTFRREDADIPNVGQVIRVKELQYSDYKVEVRGRSGRTIVLDSFQGSGGMIWPNYTHADTYIEGGWEALCEKKLVDTYYFDAVKARKEDEKNIASALMIEAIRENRKKSMYKEDVREENEPLHIRKI